MAPARILALAGMSVPSMRVAEGAAPSLRRGYGAALSAAARYHAPNRIPAAVDTGSTARTRAAGRPSACPTAADTAPIDRAVPRDRTARARAAAPPVVAPASTTIPAPAERRRRGRRRSRKPPTTSAPACSRGGGGVGRAPAPRDQRSSRRAARRTITAPTTSSAVRPSAAGRLPNTTIGSRRRGASSHGRRPMPARACRTGAARRRSVTARAATSRPGGPGLSRGGRRGRGRR